MAWGITSVTEANEDLVIITITEDVSGDSIGIDQRVDSFSKEALEDIIAIKISAYEAKNSREATKLAWALANIEIGA